MIFNNRILFKNNRLLFSLLFSGNFCGGQGFDGGGQSREGDKVEHENLVSDLFKCRVKSYLADTPCSIGFIKEVVQLLNKYDLSHHFIDWYHTGFFCPAMNGNKPSRSAFRVKKMCTGHNLLSRTNLYPKMY